jgi:hypothetical protein
MGNNKISTLWPPIRMDRPSRGSHPVATTNYPEYESRIIRCLMAKNLPSCSQPFSMALTNNVN